MPFLPPNQHRQSTEGKNFRVVQVIKSVHFKWGGNELKVINNKVREGRQEQQCFSDTDRRSADTAQRSHCGKILPHMSLYTRIWRVGRQLQAAQVTSSFKHTDRGKIPDWDGAGLAANDKCTSILQQLHWTDVVIALLVTPHNVHSCC